MERGSRLNPYAQEYIPLLKRGVENEKTEVKKGVVGEEEEEEEMETEMDIEYIKLMFPGVSDESIREVYAANKADLEATIDMIDHLEIDGSESSENLPDSLDIWDGSKPGSSTAECSSVKSKNVNVAGDVGAAASDSTAKVVIAGST